MEQVSRKKMARAIVKLLATHSAKDVMAVAAKEVVERRWTGELDILLEEIRAELWRTRRQAFVTVTSARELPVSVAADVKRMLKERLQAKTISLTSVVEPTLKGGIVASTPMGILDVSIAGRLQQLKQL